MIAKLHIETGMRNGLTFLKKTYATPPLKLADITEYKKENLLQLMLMSSSPGILDEDRYEIKIELDENCKVQMNTQSYQRLFNMKTGASHQMEISLQKGSSFFYLPHPTVPHENSKFSSYNKIYLQDDCVLAWGEVFTCGRSLNGEVFKFSSYHSITEIFRNSKLVVKENLLFRPSVTDILSIGQLEGFTHQASLIYLDDNHPGAEKNQQLYDLLSHQEGIIFGITAAPISGVIVRILGSKAEQLHDCLKTIAYQLSCQNINTKPIGIPVIIS